jgi:hypothetical protein
MRRGVKQRFQVVFTKQICPECHIGLLESVSSAGISPANRHCLSRSFCQSARDFWALLIVANVRTSAHGKMLRVCFLGADLSSTNKLAF